MDGNLPNRVAGFGGPFRFGTDVEGGVVNIGPLQVAEFVPAEAGVKQGYKIEFVARGYALEKPLQFVGSEPARGFAFFCIAFHCGDWRLYKLARADIDEKKTVESIQLIVDSGRMEAAGGFGRGPGGKQVRGEIGQEAGRALRFYKLFKIIHYFGIAGAGAGIFAADPGAGLLEKLVEGNFGIGESCLAAVDFELQIGEGKFGNFFGFADGPADALAVDGIVKVPGILSLVD